LSVRTAIRKSEPKGDEKPSKREQGFYLGKELAESENESNNTDN
jgi:hypothetical protein